MGVRADITPAKNLMLGERRTLKFTILEEDQVTPIPGGIGTWDMTWILRQDDQENSPVLISKTLSDGLTVTDATACTVEALLLPSDSVGLAPGTYWHTLWRIDSENDAVLSYGTVHFLQPVKQG